MSKKSKQIAHQEDKAVFPFFLVQWWLKSFPADSTHVCRCGEIATYACESYTDVFKYQRLLASGMSHAQATDKVWSEALTTRCNGMYTNYGTIYQCKKCAMKIVVTSVGEHNAMLITMPTMLIGVPGSILIGCKLQTPEDDGKPFASSIPASIRTIEALARQIKEKAVPLN